MITFTLDSNKGILMWEDKGSRGNVESPFQAHALRYDVFGQSYISRDINSLKGLLGITSDHGARFGQDNLDGLPRLKGSKNAFQDDMAVGQQSNHTHRAIGCSMTG
jgi:hypothetical protein